MKKLILLKQVTYENIKEENQLLRDQLTAASAFVETIKSGELKATYEGNTVDNKLASSLISLCDRMVELNLEEQQRNWVNQGLARFADILRLNQQESLTKLFDQVIASLVSYLDINQGGIFVCNNDVANDEHLELISCYAYQKKKFLKKRIELGEGLIGQCYLEKDVIYMTKVPDDYIQITSGLGNALPRSILIVPLLLDKEILGVIELASFSLFEPYKIDFIRKISDSIASTYSGVRVAVRTKELLTESQLRGEQLKAQEEEMRQNMEEMSATQEEISRRQVENENRIKAINESGIASIEFTMNGIIETANESFLKLLGYTLPEIQGKHHRIFVDSEYVKDVEYKKFWADLGNGISRPGEYERINRDGAKVFIRGSYSIIHDQNGKPVKVLKLATDVTQLREQQKQTEDLLKEAKQQNEEMKAQEEELRQNMEELSTTQEEIARRQAETENRLKAIDESGIASIEFTMNGIIETANESFLNLLGFTLSEIQGKHHRMFVDSEYAKNSEYKKFWSDLGNGISRPGEYERITKGGEKVFIRGSYSIIHDRAGKPVKVLKLATDITIIREQQKQTEHLLKEAQQQNEEMKAQEEELRQNMEELSTTQEEIARRQAETENRLKAIDESGIASIEFAMNGIIETANESFLNLMGYTLPEIQGKHHRMFVDSEYVKNSEYKKFWSDLGNGISRPGEYERINKTGDKVFIRGSYSIIYDRTGKPVKVLKLATDITIIRDQQKQTEDLLKEAKQQNEEMKAQEEELRQNMEELSTTQEEIARRQAETENRLKAIDESGIASIEFNLNGVIENANEGFLKLMGYTLPEIQGKHHRMFVDSEYVKNSEYKKFWDDLGNGIARPGEYERISKTGKKIYIRGSYSILSDRTGRPAKVLKLATDVTLFREQQRRTEHLLEEAQQRAKK